MQDGLNLHRSVMVFLIRYFAFSFDLYSAMFYNLTSKKCKNICFSSIASVSERKLYFLLVLVLTIHSVLLTTQYVCICSKFGQFVVNLDKILYTQTTRKIFSTFKRFAIASSAFTLYYFSFLVELRLLNEDIYVYRASLFLG